MDFLIHNNEVFFGFIAQGEALLSLCGLFQFLKVSEGLDCSGRMLSTAIIFTKHTQFHKTIN